MSLLGIDMGTTGAKAVAFSREGGQLASAYQEYDVERPEPGWSQLDAPAIWNGIKGMIRKVASETAGSDPIEALAVSSFGEAVVPVDEQRRILAPSLLSFDTRGDDFLDELGEQLDDEWLYRINGNALGGNYGLTKLLWIQRRQPDVYEKAEKFLLWGGFVPFMLGGEPTVDYSLANRTLCFDLQKRDWSDEVLERVGFDRAKLPRTIPAGTAIGQVSKSMATELGLNAGVAIVAGAHDQCSNALGCGVTQPGAAMYGMGTYLCAVPVFSERRDTASMLRLGLNTEHHASPDRFVSFIYNEGGALLKWFRDTFAATDRDLADEAGKGIYEELMKELPDGPSPVMALPHFLPTGPPEHIADSSGALLGLRPETTRGQILKGLLDCATYYLRENIASARAVGIKMDSFRAVGGGSKSDAWVQLSADILNRPFIRMSEPEAGALGTAMLAGVGAGVFASVEQGVEAMVRVDKRVFEPDPSKRAPYDERFAQYERLWPTIKDYARELGNG